MGEKGEKGLNPTKTCHENPQIKKNYETRNILCIFVII